MTALLPASRKKLPAKVPVPPLTSVRFLNSTDGLDETVMGGSTLALWSPVPAIVPPVQVVCPLTVRLAEPASVPLRSEERRVGKECRTLTVPPPTLLFATL